jgi:hypothetical protein
MNGNLPAMYKRMSPVPGRPPTSCASTVTAAAAAAVLQRPLSSAGPARPPSNCSSGATRGTSPVARQQPLLLSNSLEVQQQVWASLKKKYVRVYYLLNSYPTIRYPVLANSVAEPLHFDAAPAPTLMCTVPVVIQLFSKAQKLTLGLGLVISMIFND